MKIWHTVAVPPGFSASGAPFEHAFGRPESLERAEEKTEIALPGCPSAHGGSWTLMTSFRTPC